MRTQDISYGNQSEFRTSGRIKFKSKIHTHTHTPNQTKLNKKQLSNTSNLTELRWFKLLLKYIVYTKKNVPFVSVAYGFLQSKHTLTKQYIINILKCLVTTPSRTKLPDFFHH